MTYMMSMILSLAVTGRLEVMLQKKEDKTSRQVTFTELQVESTWSKGGRLA